MFWKLEEARFVRELISTSAADSNNVYLPPVPQGKVWIILAAYYQPSVNETQVVHWRRISRSNAEFPTINPVSLSLNPARFTFIEQGMEYVLFPGEGLAVYRSAHTAGSTMSASILFIEIDLPLYTYDEPQIVKRQNRALSSIRTRLGGGGGGSSGGGGVVPPGGGPGGGGGGPLPV